MTTLTPASADYEPVRTSRAFEEVTAQLRRRVIHGHLKPGDRLPPERDLAVKLGVSRNTVREALRGLEMAGVLRSQKGTLGGAFILAPDGKTLATALQDMFQLGSISPAELTESRLLITESVVQLACHRITEEQIKELESNVEQSLAESNAGNMIRRSQVNLEFHNILARATGNPVFVAVISGLIAVMQTFIDTLGPPTGPEVFESRKRFIAYLRARQPEAAIQEMTDFLRSVHHHYLSRLDTVDASSSRD